VIGLITRKLIEWMRSGWGKVVWAHEEGIVCSSYQCMF